VQATLQLVISWRETVEKIYARRLAASIPKSGAERIFSAADSHRYSWIEIPW